jgi:hypothetical protein
MTTPRTLGDYVAELKRAAIVPRPDPEEWSALINRISQTGTVAAIHEETYFYFLEVLPPKFQRGGLFAFAEGAEPLRLFWQKGTQYFCRPLTWDETKEFCRLSQTTFPYWF